MSDDPLAVSLLVSGIAVLVFVGTWVVLMVLTTPKGSLEQQLERLKMSSALYRLTFVNASLIAPSVVTMLVLTGQIPDRRPGVLDLPGVVFLAAYLAVITVVYTSQYTVFPPLLRRNHELAALLYFGDHRSFPYYGALLAYALFGVAAIFLAPPLLGAGGVWTWAGWLLFASGVGSVVGFVGYTMKIKALEFLNVVAGVLVVPLAVLVVIGAGGL
jgi:hypothetical protein